MILLVVIVQSEDAAKLSERLIGEGFRLTRLNATGGFLAAGSSVLLIGAEDDHLPAVTAIIEATCHTRTRLINAAPYPGMAGVYAMGTVAPVEVLVGGAVVVGLPVLRFLRCGGHDAPPAADRPPSAESPATSERISNMTPGTDAASADATTAGSAAGPATDPAVGPAVDPADVAHQHAGTAGTRLVVAVIQKENSDTVVNALMDAGHRLTRIDTAGGFLRRGNATLLIGVEAALLDDVLAIIQANCKPRTEPTPIEAGMPMYSATVFVVDASHFLRF